MTVAYRSRMVGPGNPAWRGGKWKYKGIGWREISAAVLRGARCFYCPAAPSVAHHLIPQRFWIDLDAANVRTNLVACCNACHGARPEHYWRCLPDAIFDPLLHVRTGARRTRHGLRPYPACAVCGEPCKRHRSRFCSYSCSNRAKWTTGIYGPDLVRNITRTRREAE
jgi:5-methylcytosine-specific restriction endonuclease McrA